MAGDLVGDGLCRLTVESLGDVLITAVGGDVGVPVPLNTGLLGDTGVLGRDGDRGVPTSVQDNAGEPGLTDK